ncbi:titin isoform X8 [Bombyx mori]|uniref:titin isoform X8 n=1 Tax=Bombyx mori TaxID=7091 RepID=UPI002ED51B3C
MPTEEVLGPRKTMLILVIVVGCFAMLWPRILSPLILGHTREQLKPNEFDREAGCCEVMFGTELAVLELINEVCSSAVHLHSGKLSANAAAECRKAVNETCGVDIVAFLKRSDNIGKSSKSLVETMKNSNSSCLKENFGVPVMNLGPHIALNSWTLQDTIKQERPLIRGAGPHPALRERGRAIPPGTAAPSRTITMPPHARVRSPLSVYFEPDIKPPPIPGMRPPLGSPGGPVAAPKTSMGFIMPIYTVCIVVFFVYTLSKILFKRAGTPYEPVRPDPCFRRRVFRDDSRTSPDKLGPKERDAIVTAISGLVAEVQDQMEASEANNQQRQEAAENPSRSYTNGTVLHNVGPVHIVTSEYRETSEEREREPSPLKEASPEKTQTPSEPPKSEPTDDTPEHEQSAEPATDEDDLRLSSLPKESSPEKDDTVQEEVDKSNETTTRVNETDKDDETPANDRKTEVIDEVQTAETELRPEIEVEPKENDLLKLTGNGHVVKDNISNITEDFLNEAKTLEENKKTEDLLEEAIKDESEEEQDNGSVKHEAEEVKSIYLEAEIPQKSRVLVADFGEDRPEGQTPASDTMVVSGKMTLSLIQDEPRETPERDPESTVDEFTTASAVTQPAPENQPEEDSEEEEIEEEIEIEEIEEEVEEEELDENELVPAKLENGPKHTE